MMSLLVWSLGLKLFLLMIKALNFKFGILLVNKISDQLHGPTIVVQLELF